MCLKSYLKKIVLKLATNGQSDKGFLFASTFVPKELSAPALGLYTCTNALKYIPGPGVRWAFTGPLIQDYFFLGHRIALPCGGFSLESHSRCIFNEYPHRVLWRNKQNYPLIITKYPPYLFHFLCAQRRLRSAWAVWSVFVVRSLSS